ncbi:type II secretion system F family protein [Microbacterium allomyrinae]|uniref:type II secretion system F family protein n=1 Tax=Microbacterium allomyrinae TaxID=2830666 RepID=UPI001E28C76C|nr:type II secretion system F family protein [Microbacterium allomyrinae]
MARRVSAPDASAAAETVLRLAVLLQAGVAPARAWSHLAESGDPSARRVVAGLESGMPLSDAIAGAGPGAWHDIAAAWRVATTVGAPLAESLRGLASALRDAQEATDEIRVALAEPEGTARLMAWLPLVAVGLGAVLGFDTFGVLFGQPMGIACLVAGAALIVAAHRWTRRLVRRAGAEGGVPGLDAELLAIALGGGVSIERATAIVGRSRPTAGRGDDASRSGAEPGGDRNDGDTRTGTGAGAEPGARDGAGERAGVGAPDRARASAYGSPEEVLALSRVAGVPAVELLRASAAHARHRARVDGRLRAARLSSRLLLPLGVCTLPAFLLLGVAPMLLSVMSTMPLSL